MILDWFFISWALLVVAAVIIFIRCLIFPNTLDFLILLIVILNCFICGNGRWYNCSRDHNGKCHH